MTREEAYKLREQGFSNEHNTWVDKIYDDFESRTCGNCKYCISNYCNSENDTTQSSYVPRDFGCTWWVAKNESN